MKSQRSPYNGQNGGHTSGVKDWYTIFFVIFRPAKCQLVPKLWNLLRTRSFWTLTFRGPPKGPTKNTKMGPRGTHGDPWAPMGTYEHPWAPIGTQGHPLGILGVPFGDPRAFWGCFWSLPEGSQDYFWRHFGWFLGVLWSDFWVSQNLETNKTIPLCFIFECRKTHKTHKGRGGEGSGGRENNNKTSRTTT